MSEARQFKDHHREARLFFGRALFAGLVITVLTTLLVVRYYSLQVTHHEDYVTQSDRNRVHVLPIPPTRGLIYDRNGELLAENRASYTLSIVHERVDDLGRTLAVLAELVNIAPNDIEKFNDQLRQRRRPFDAVPLRYNLTEEEIARLAVNEFRLDGVEVHAQLVRHYTHGELFAHTIGYVGRISERELASFDEQEYQAYAGTHSIGKNGLERSYESDLLGEVGYQNVETNARGRVLRVLESGNPKPGKDLVLHLDTYLQEQALAALEGHRGAVVAIDVNTGGVLAAVSAPSFDANLFVTGISFKDYRELNQSRDLPLFNRFLQGQYPPGSTVKPIIGMAGLHYDIVTPSDTVYDPGFYRLANSSRVYRDWKRHGHGAKVDLKQAIAESCDTYFYDLGHKMGIDKMHAFGYQFGMGEKTGIDVPNERRGIWPSRDWKRGARGQPWYPGDNLNVAIGQGDVLATPMQLAVMTATLASKGVRYKPHMVASVGGQPVEPEVMQSVQVEETHWDAILGAMEEVVHGVRGTAQRIRRGADYRMAGKTGTAQVVAIAQGEEYDSEALSERNRDHALFVGFAPFENPQIAVAVLVENAESGSGAAAPVARKVFDAWLADKHHQHEGES
ncbi:penicillin-binding protein 2 [Gilvimarinus chinensis]|uniref:penicillin-binding protein 2 n=1 Tax=Gilvimarinus chinensis TaxID=396005 RepID=UPI000370580F|nr:penicillin-binding protein 2 [Gilvimarinus chinensis]